jgi:alanine-synthesizing transaminase
MAARFRRHRSEDHLTHESDRGDQPQQPDRGGVLSRNSFADSRIGPTASVLLLSDEIYDKILYDDAKHVPMAAVAPDLLCLTFNGPSKAYRVAGYRAGWLVITGPKDHARSFLDGISLLANMRLCPNVPAQHAVQVALGGYQSIDDLILPGGRLREQRDVPWSKLNAISGVSCVKPQGALYAFPDWIPRFIRSSTTKSSRSICW